MKFRPLNADEIDIRVGSVSEKGATLLFYKNARVDMAILDETVGEGNWQRDHKEVKGNLFCGIGIRASAIGDLPSDEWIWKWDCGTESYTEKEKGEASDSFKRAGFNWGIGRELYTAPFTFVKCETLDGATGWKLKNKYMFNGAFVSEIAYEEISGNRVISKVTVCDSKGNQLFKYDKKKSYVKDEKRSSEELAKVEMITKGGIDFLENRIKEVGADLPKLLEYYGVSALGLLTAKQFEDCVKKLNSKETENEKKN